MFVHSLIPGAFLELLPWAWPAVCCRGAPRSSEEPPQTAQPSSADFPPRNTGHDKSFFKIHLFFFKAVHPKETTSK